MPSPEECEWLARKVDRAKGSERSRENAGNNQGSSGGQMWGSGPDEGMRDTREQLLCT